MVDEGGSSRKPRSGGPPPVAIWQGHAAEHSDTFRLATEVEIDETKVDRHLVSLTEPESMEAESYRRLRYSVELAGNDELGSVFAICSPAPGDGKTMASINLAGAIAQNPDAKVILLELDLRKSFSSISEYIGIDANETRPGLVEKVRDPSLLWGDVVRYLPVYNLHIMTSGRRTSQPYEILRSKRLEKLIAEARQRYDYVVIDTPPIVLLPDSQIISLWVDGIIIVVTSGVTSRAYLAETLNLLGPDKVLGLIFNDSSPGFMEGYYDYAYPDLHRSNHGLFGRIDRLFNFRRVARKR